MPSSLPQTQEQVRTIYQQHVVTYEKEVRDLQQRIQRWSQWRFLCFLSTIGILIYAVKNQNSILALVTLLLGPSAFVVAVVRHTNCYRKRDRAQRLVEINQRGLQRCQHQWSDFNNTGVQYLPKNHPYAADLDVLGQHSLFQWFNTAHSEEGQAQVIQRLLHGVDQKQLPEEQAAIQELAAELSWRQDYEELCIALQQVSKVNALTHLQSPVESSWLRGNRHILSSIPFIISGIAIVAMCIGSPLSWRIAILLLAVQGLVCAFITRRYQQFIERALQWEQPLFILLQRLQCIAQLNCKQIANQQVQISLNQGIPSALKEIQRLHNLVSYFSLRNNPPLHWIANTLFAYDWQFLQRIETWRSQHANSVQKWQHLCALMEARASFAVIAYENPEWKLPEFHTSPTLIAEHLGHPLLPIERRIDNDFQLTTAGNLAILTGSNMSGKSTFMRALGLNLVLAYSGAPVCAKRLVCHRMPIFCSMRIADDVNQGISSFYAELLQIKRILGAAEKGPVLYFIDEIFRGTNSVDRIEGAKAVIHHLLKSTSIGIISTHDMELSQLSNLYPQQLQNHHFSEHYNDQGIAFSYRLQDGPSTTTNAKHLLRMVGISLPNQDSL